MGLKKTYDGWDRWACLAAAMVMQACGGLGYTFAVYSQHLKERLDYDQEDLDDIGAAKDFGYCIGIIGGILYNFIPPWLTVSVGSLLHFVGYFMVYMTSAGRVQPSFLMVCGFIAFGVGGDSWVDTAALMTSVQNFTEYRGTAIGLLKAQVGLSGAIFVTLYKAFLEPDVDRYIFLVAIAPAVTSATLAVFIRPSNGNQNETDGSTERRFQLAYGGTIALGLYLLLSIFLQAWLDVGRSWLVFFAVTMLIHFSLISILVALYRPLRRFFNWVVGGNPGYIYSEAIVNEPRLEGRNLDSHLEEDSDICKEDLENHRTLTKSHRAKQTQGYYILDSVNEERMVENISVVKSDARLEDDKQPLKGQMQDNQIELENDKSLSSHFGVQNRGYHVLKPQSEEVMNLSSLQAWNSAGLDTVGRTQTSETQDFQGGFQTNMDCLQSPVLVQNKGYHSLEATNQGPLKSGQMVMQKEDSEDSIGAGSYSLLQCLQSVNFWLLCCVAVTGPGTGLAVINNFGQMARSLKSESVELFVGLISVASCFGRLAAGSGSDFLLQYTPYPRTLCLTFTHLVMTIGCLMLSAGYVPLLYLGSTLVGSSYGAFWALTPTIISEIFGIQNFAALYKFIGTCGPVGAYLFSAKLVGQFYDEEAEYYHAVSGLAYSDEHDNICVGQRCFGFSMLVLAVVCIVGASIGAVLSIRTRRIYAEAKLSLRTRTPQDEAELSSFK